MDAQTVDALLAQLSSEQGNSGAGGISSDALTQAILERLNEEVAKVYAESGTNGGGGGGGGGMAHSSPSRASLSGSSTLGSRTRPLPAELWKAAHESGKEAKSVSIIIMIEKSKTWG